MPRAPFLRNRSIKKRQDWYAHQLDKRLKCFSPLDLCRINYGFQRRVSFCRPLGAKTVSHFSMNHRWAQRLFASVVGRRYFRMCYFTETTCLALA